jgi:hypothetical protein
MTEYQTLLFRAYTEFRALGCWKMAETLKEILIKELENGK